MRHLDEPDPSIGRILFGAAIMGLGVLFLLDRLDLLETEALAAYWPVLLVGYGLARIVWPHRPGAETGGVWIALAGGVWLLDRLDVAPIRESWPLFVIVAGLMVVFRALGWLPSGRCGRPHSWTEARR